MKYFSDPGCSDLGPPYSHLNTHLHAGSQSSSISPSNTSPDVHVRDNSHSCLVLKSGSLSKPKVTLDLKSQTSTLQTTIVSRPMVRPCIISGSSGLLHESSALGSDYSYAESSNTTGVGLGLGPGPAPTSLIDDGCCYGPNCEGNCEKKDEFDYALLHMHTERRWSSLFLRRTHVPTLVPAWSTSLQLPPSQRRATKKDPGSAPVYIDTTPYVTACSPMQLAL